jgi:hypothetical protein
MSAVYHLRTYTPAGVLTAVITDFLTLSYVKGVNEPGMLQFALNGNHGAIAWMELDAQVEVWRSDSVAGIDWYCDFYGLWRAERRSHNQDGTSLYTATCPGQMSLLARSIVAYPAHTNDRSRFNNSPAETTAKLLVRYNATTDGTTGDGRTRDVSLSGISIETDGAHGDAFDYNCAWRNLLAAVQEVAQIGGGAFDLIKTNAAAWEFRWYDGQRGKDHSDTVTFALQYGNMATPVLVRSGMDEKTVAIVGGQGEEDARTLVVRTGPNYSAPHNAIETFVDARSYTTTDGLNAEGDRELDTLRRRDGFTFDVLQVPSTLYGIHYNVGDLVTSVYQDVNAVKVVQRVTVTVGEDGREQIKVEMADE